MRRALIWLIVCGLAAACRRPLPAPPPGVLRTAASDDVPTLDPAIGYDTVSWQFEDLLYNTLLDYDDASRLVPEVATRWEISPDGLSYTFFLDPRPRFSNGRPVVAADVQYSIERVLRPATRSQGAEFFTGIDGAEAFVTGRAPRVAGIEGLDAYTVRFRLAAFDPLFLHKLAMQFAAIVPREVAEPAGEDFSTHPVGSGPFVLDEWQRGRWLRLRRNPDYFVPGVPKIEAVHHLIGANEQLQWLKYESGELDVVTPIPTSEFPSVIRDPAYRGRLVHETEMTTAYLGINCAVPPFADARVRRAVGHAINREKALRLINSRGEVAHGILPPSMLGYDAALHGPEFDPERARRLLRQAGLGAGFATTLWARTDETWLRLAQSYQQDLAEVGIQVRIKNLSWASYLEALRTPGMAPLFILRWQADFPDPSNFLEVLFHSRNIGSNNHSFFGDPGVDALLDRAAATVDPAQRLEVLGEAHARILEASPWVPIYYQTTYAALHPRVRNYKIHPLRPPRLEDVELVDAPSAAVAE